MAHLVRSVMVGLLVAGLCAGHSLVDAGGRREGDVQVIDVEGSYGPLAGGGSARQFTLRPGTDGTCPGDSQHDNWRVQGFLVPATVDPSTLHYLLQDPDTKGGKGLFDIYGTPVAQTMLEPNDVAGQPAHIPALRPLSFSVYRPGDIPPGHYRLGLACTQWRQTNKFWDVGVTVVADPTDQPAGFRWTVDGASPAASAKGSAPWWLIGVAGMVAALVGGLLLRRRRSNGSVAVHPDASHADREVRTLSLFSRRIGISRRIGRVEQ
jgi:hypothetical protein